MKIAISAVTVLVAALLASADPVLTWSKVDVGSYDVWTLGVQGDQGPAGWNMDVDFTGSFHQELVDGATHVDVKSEADAQDGVLGYEKETDCWYYDDHWVGVAPDTSDLSSTTAITLESLGSIPGDPFASADVFQFVVDNGSTITYSGVLSYAGEDYVVSGSISDSVDADLDLDGDVDGIDFLTFAVCYNGSLNPPKPECSNGAADLDSDGDVDGVDFLTFSGCYNGALNPPRCP